MRIKVYNFLVNKHAGISDRYHKVHDGTTGTMKIFSWLYLLWLNFAYYILQIHSLGDKKDAQIYEEKNAYLVKLFREVNQNSI